LFLIGLKYKEIYFLVGQGGLMNAKSLVILCLVGVKFLSAADAPMSTEIVVRQALQQSAGKKKVFKTVMAAANRYGEAQIFIGLVRRCGLQYGLNNYGGKKNPRGKRITKFLSLLPQGQKITLLAPLSEGLLPTLNKIRAAEDKGDKPALKAALADALNVVKNHIIKGEFTQATLKGQMDTLGGTKINADNLKFYEADIKAGNGMFHIIKGLSTDVAPVAEPVVDVAVKAEAAPAPVADKPAEKSADTAVHAAESAKPVEPAKVAEVPVVAKEVAKPVDAVAAAVSKVDKPVEVVKEVAVVAPANPPVVKEEAKPVAAPVAAAPSADEVALAKEA
jgi:hypothetical protein